MKIEGTNIFDLVYGKPVNNELSCVCDWQLWTIAPFVLVKLDPMYCLMPGVAHAMNSLVQVVLVWFGL